MGVSGHLDPSGNIAAPRKAFHMDGQLLHAVLEASLSSRRVR